VSSGLLRSAQSLLAGLLALGRTRLELFGTELQAELTRLFLAVVGAVAVLLLAGFGVSFVTFAVLLALAPEHRPLAAAGIGAVFLAGAFAAFWSLRRLGRERPHAFAGSLAELERDREALQP
jgi:uncharacterized membrane protein YqjE